MKEINNRMRSVISPPTNLHVLLMRSLLDVTGAVCSSPDYTNVIALLEKVIAPNVLRNYWWNGTIIIQIIVYLN